MPAPAVQARIDRLLDGSNKTKAFASVTVAGAYAIHGIRVIESEKGRFVAMPQDSYQKDGQKKYRDIFHAITAEARTALNSAVEAAYLQTLQMRQVSTQVQSAANDQQAAAQAQLVANSQQVAAPAPMVQTPDAPVTAPAPTTQTPADPAPEPAMGMVMGM